MTKMTPTERARYDAQAKEEAWGYAESMLLPWIETTRAIGSDELTQAMEVALEEVQQQYRRAVDELEAAEAKL